MKIRTIQRLYDDFGQECAIGDTVLLQTKETDEQLVQATLTAVMTSIAEFVVDDRALGYVKIKARPQDIMHVFLHTRKPLDPIRKLEG